jgi:hypothetical protein
MNKVWFQFNNDNYKFDDDDHNNNNNNNNMIRVVTMVRNFQHCSFSGLDPSLNILKKKPVRFGSWLCSRLQVEIPILVDLIQVL